jgi:SAM-dependent methyltransferase
VDRRPLHEQEPLERFSGRAADYARFRPDYPAGAIDAVLGGLGAPEQLIAADVGAGTGISARLLADRGVRVFAVEPNAGMRDAAAPHDRVTWVAGQAERTGLPDGAVQLATAFQAFHWFDPEAALAELRRILRPLGRLALVWNKRDRGDPFTAAYGELIARLATTPPADDRGSPAALRTSPHFGDVRTVVIRHVQPLALEGLLGRARSTSYLPSEGEPAEELYRELEKLHVRFAGPGGTVPLTYATEVHLATAA